MLSPKLISGKDRRFIGVVRHPADQKPNANRHDVIVMIGELPRRPRASQWPDITRLMAEAAQWIETAGPADDYPPLPGYGPLDRQRRYRSAHAEARRERAELLRGLRRGLSFAEAVAQYGKDRVQKALARWPRLRAGIGRPKRNYQARRLPPRPTALRQRLEAELKQAEAQALCDAAPHREQWWGRAALARELLALWPDSRKHEERTVMTRRDLTPPQHRLREIMERDSLSRQDVANLVAGGKLDTVNAWLKPPTSHSHRNIPETSLRLLDLVTGTRICAGLSGIQQWTGGTEQDVKRQVSWGLVCLAGWIMANPDLGQDLVDGATRRVGEQGIIAPHWAFWPIQGPTGRCYAAVPATVARTPEGTYRLVSDTLDQAEAWIERRQPAEETARQTRIQELLRETRMYEAQHADAVARGDFAEASRIDQALAALDLCWRSIP